MSNDMSKVVRLSIDTINDLEVWRTNRVRKYEEHGDNYLANMFSKMSLSDLVSQCAHYVIYAEKQIDEMG